MPVGVGKDYFAHIKNVKTELGNEHMEAYVAILAKAPHVAKVHGVNERNIPLGISLQKAVEDAWKAMHGDKLAGWEPDVNTEEVIPDEHLDILLQFAEGLQPEWGGLKRWIDADKVCILLHFVI